MKLWIIAGLLLACPSGRAQSVSTLMGGRAAGMGYASSTLRDEAAFFNNVGAMGWSTKSSCFSAYEAQPSLPGANRIAASVCLANKWIAGGIGIFRFGDEVYGEQLVSAALSNRFGMTSLGAKVNYIQYQVAGFGNKTGVTLDFGGLAQITPQILVGAYMVNLTQASLNGLEQLPTKFVAGICFRPSDFFLLATDIAKDLGYDATWRIGTEYTIYKKVFLRTGFNLHPSTVCVGMGVQTKRIHVDYALQYHANQTGTHQASLALALGKNPNK